MKPQIMIVGTQHYHENFRNSEPDELFLESLNTLKDSLINFQPTRICIEQEAKIQEILNDEFNSYNPDRFYKNEAYDLGFYTAKKAKLKSVIAMDWMEQDYVTNGMTDSYEWAKNYDLSFIEHIEKIQSSHAKISKMNNPYKITLELNKPESYKMDEELYSHMMLLGEDSSISIPWLTWWYKRNMIMVNNVTRNLVNSDKVIIIVGSGHIYILKQLLEASNKFDVTTFYERIENS